MKLRKILSILIALCLLAALTGCGASSKSEAYSYAAGSAAQDMAVAETMAAAGAPMANGVTMDTTSQQETPQGRKWIVTMNISTETEDLNALMEAVQLHIAQLGGYVEHQNQRNGSIYAERRYRYASLTIRIPAAQADEFARNVGEYSNVVHSSKSLEDITLQYVDTESRVKALETEQARLLELLAQAETMSDLLEIESRLTDVRYELENHSSQLRLYDNLVDYATIYLDIEEVTEYTPPVEQTLWQRISTGFTKSLKGVGQGAVDLFVWITVNSPYLAVAGAVIFLAVLAKKKLKIRLPRIRRKKASKEKDTGNP